MKSAIPFAVLFFAFVAFSFTVSPTKAFDPGVGEYSVSIPAVLESHIVKETLDNAVAYKFKKADGTTQFLFSVNQTSFEQWTVVRDQMPTAKLIGEKNGFIYYAETTTRQSMKGTDKEAYAAAYAQLDGIVKSIKL